MKQTLINNCNLNSNRKLIINCLKMGMEAGGRGVQGELQRGIKKLWRIMYMFIILKSWRVHGYIHMPKLTVLFKCSLLHINYVTINLFLKIVRTTTISSKRKKWMGFISIILDERRWAQKNIQYTLACGSSQARDETCATVMTTLDP